MNLNTPEFIFCKNHHPFSKSIKVLILILFFLLIFLDSFRIGTSYEKEFLPECKEENWVSLKKGTGLAKILYDFAGYMIFIEDYAKCRNCLQRLKQIDKVSFQFHGNVRIYIFIYDI